MRLLDLYRGFLFLYPGDFRRQFSQEMISVFQQRAGERRESLPFFLREFSSIVKGASIMWLAKVLSVNRDPSPLEENTTGTPVTVAELDSQRQSAIKKMVASIARHDFPNARRYSYEEARLKRMLCDREAGSLPSGSGSAE
jgi:hypothetical protein